MKKILFLLSFVCGISYAAPILPIQGGTGISTNPANGMILMGNSAGKFALTLLSTAAPSGGSGVSVYNATSTAGFPYGLSGSTAVFSSTMTAGLMVIKDPNSAAYLTIDWQAPMTGDTAFYPVLSGYSSVGSPFSVQKTGIYLVGTADGSYPPTLLFQQGSPSGVTTEFYMNDYSEGGGNNNLIYGGTPLELTDTSTTSLLIDSGLMDVGSAKNNIQSQLNLRGKGNGTAGNH
jgi:hypothetical protein